MRASRKHLVSFILMGLLLLGLLAFLVIAPMIERSRNENSKTLCVHNLKLLALVLKMYAVDHGGVYPNKFSELGPKYLIEADFLVCPQQKADYEGSHRTPYPLSLQSPPDQIDALSSYVLVPGLRTSDAPDKVLAYERADNHHGQGKSLIYLDGHGAWEPPENWRGGPRNTNLPPGF